MNTQQTQDKAAPQYLDLAANQAITLRAARGTVVRSLQGRVWLTQDYDQRDYVVPAGARYCAAGAGRIVVSAIDGASRVAVYRVRPEPTGLWARNAVRFDSDFAGTLENAARQAMADQVAALARKAWQALRRGWRRSVQARIHMATPPALRTRSYHG